MLYSWFWFSWYKLNTYTCMLGAASEATGIKTQNPISFDKELEKRELGPRDIDIVQFTLQVQPH